MESEAGKDVVRSGRKESWGAILRERFVRAGGLWRRVCWRRGRSSAAGRMGRDMLIGWRVGAVDDQLGGGIVE